MIALVSLGVADVTTRIAELRKAGYDIRDQWDRDHFERRYKTYFLAPQEEGEVEGFAPVDQP
jgi:hypothetical protein